MGGLPQEWPTPFHFLLYRLVSITTDWAEQCARINDAEIPVNTLAGDNFDRHFISKEAAKALGEILQGVIQSEKISTSFKKYLIEIAIRSYITLQRGQDLNDVATTFIIVVIRGTDIPTQLPYLIRLQNIFGRISPSMKRDATGFEAALAEAQTKAQSH